MSLRFEHSFIVKTDPDRVFAYLTDPYRVAPALPGASVTEKVDDSTYNGGIVIKVGPVSARYRGTVRFESLDPAARTAVLVAKGQDVSGRGGADMRMQSGLMEKAPGETEVSMVSEVNITGVMAQFGRGLIQDVSNQMLETFTKAMRAELEKPEAAASSPSPAEDPSPAAKASATASSNGASSAAPADAPAAAPPVEVLSFGSRLLVRAAGRTAQRPMFWVVAVVVAVSLYWLFSTSAR